MLALADLCLASYSVRILISFLYTYYRAFSCLFYNSNDDNLSIVMLDLLSYSWKSGRLVKGMFYLDR